MRALVFLVAFAIPLPPGPLAASAGGKGAPSRSGASARPAASSLPGDQECLQLAVNGRFEGECAADHESDGCVGLSLALRNSLKREECRVRAGEGCLEYGYRQNAQAEWVAVAAGFLAQFGQCVRNRYGSESSNGFKEALADAGFRSMMHELDDGASAFGLRPGEIVERMLKEESLPSILKTAPNWQTLDARLRERMLVAADTPIPVTEAPEPARAESPPLRPRPGGGGSRAGGRSPAGLHAGAVTAPGPAAVAGEWQLNANGIEELARAPAAAADDRVFVRNVKANPYSLGLDLNLFDRVSLTYRKRSPALRGVSDYVKSMPKREPKTVRELLERHRGLEL